MATAFMERFKHDSRGKKQACLFLLSTVFLSFCGCLHRPSDSSSGSAVLSAENSPQKGLAQATVSDGQRTDAATDHEPFTRQAFDLAIESGKKGNHTFGALLVYQGKVILIAENTTYTENDNTRHAEINLVAKAKREISPEVLQKCTMYTSTAPCTMCSAAICYMGIRKIVYGVSYEALEELTGFHDPGMPCDKLFQYAGKELNWIGPILEEEGLKVFQYWPKRGSSRFSTPK